MQLFEDRIGGGSPLERLAVRVVRRVEVIDALHELSDAGERANPMGSNGCVRSSAWHWLFSSPPDTALVICVDEERVVGQLEAFGAVRLQAGLL